MTPSGDPRLLVHAYVDGELDPAHALEVERQLAADPSLAAERERIEALRRAIAQQLPRDVPLRIHLGRVPLRIRLGARSPPRSRWRHSSVAAPLGLCSPPAQAMPI